MLTLLARILKALNSETSARSLAIAVVLGMFLGLTPLWRVHNNYLTCSLDFPSQFITVSGLVRCVFGLAYLLDPMFHSFGESILRADSWQAIYEAVYATAIGRVSCFITRLRWKLHFQPHRQSYRLGGDLLHRYYRDGFGNV